MHLCLIWSFEITLLGIESFTLTLVYSQAITRDRWAFSPPPPPSPCPNSCCVSKPFPTLDPCPGRRNGISLCITPSDVTRGYKMNMTLRGPLLPCHCSLSPSQVKSWESPSENGPSGKKSRSFSWDQGLSQDPLLALGFDCFDECDPSNVFSLDSKSKYWVQEIGSGVGQLSIKTPPCCHLNSTEGREESKIFACKQLKALMAMLHWNSLSLHHQDRKYSYPTLTSTSTLH